MKKILVLNSGSSSLKYQLFNVEGENYNVIAKGVADRIGIHGSFIEIRLTGQDKRKREVALPTHNEAIVEVIKELLNGALTSMEEIDAVGHRVVQGGDYFKNSDFNMLTSLPLTKLQIITSKVVYGYLFDIVSFIIVILPIIIFSLLCQGEYCFLC